MLRHMDDYLFLTTSLAAAKGFTRWVWRVHFSLILLHSYTRTLITSTRLHINLRV
jgi:hypothetical protein